MALVCWPEPIAGLNNVPSAHMRPSTRTTQPHSHRRDLLESNRLTISILRHVKQTYSCVEGTPPNSRCSGLEPTPRATRDSPATVRTLSASIDDSPSQAHARDHPERKLAISPLPASGSTSLRKYHAGGTPSAVKLHLRPLAECAQYIPASTLVFPYGDAAGSEGGQRDKSRKQSESVERNDFVGVDMDGNRLLNQMNAQHDIVLSGFTNDLPLDTT